jgi:hypothetical protein
MWKKTINGVDDKLLNNTSWEGKQANMRYLMLLVIHYAIITDSVMKHETKAWQAADFRRCSLPAMMSSKPSGKKKGNLSDTVENSRWITVWPTSSYNTTIDFEVL